MFLPLCVDRDPDINAGNFGFVKNMPRIYTGMEAGEYAGRQRRITGPVWPRLSARLQTKRQGPVIHE